MNGFRGGSVSWRAILHRKTAYAPEQTAGRLQGHRCCQLVPADVSVFYLCVEDKSLPNHDPAHRFSVEPGVDASFVKSVKPWMVELRDLQGFDSIGLAARKMTDLRVGAVIREIAILELKRGTESVFLVHAPRETIVQRKCPL